MVEMDPDHSKFKWGFIPGIILPPLFMAIYFFVNVDGELGYAEYFKEMVKERIFPALVAVSAIINLLLFYVFLHKEKWRAGRGVILATMIYAFIMLGFKFL